jgi:hypothetical protein
VIVTVVIGYACRPAETLIVTRSAVHGLTESVPVDDAAAGAAPARSRRVALAATAAARHRTAVAGTPGVWR